eukprot:5676552-Prymnesium_polylepis.1
MRAPMCTCVACPRSRLLHAPAPSDVPYRATGHLHPAVTCPHARAQGSCSTVRTLLEQIF